MKKVLLFLAIASTTLMWSQTDGLTYQAVIINPQAKELPGVNATGTILHNTPLTLRFSIIDHTGGIEFQESQSTQTDEFGIVNLIIGQGNSEIGSFTEIKWEGLQKDLLVEINLSGDFVSLEEQTLTFVPYAYHRDINATGNLSVDGPMILQGDLTVNGAVDLNARLKVFDLNPTLLSGQLTVEKITGLNDSLSVNNNSAAILDGSLTVIRETELNNSLLVGERTKLKDVLDVVGATTVRDSLTVTDANPVLLSGTMEVGGEANFNSDVSINNGSDLSVSGNTTVNGEITFNQDMTVEGNTTLNGLLNVNNGSPTNLSGSLTTGGQTVLQNTLLVDGATGLGNLFRVNNQSPTLLTGALTVDLATQLNSGLFVTSDQSLTYLSGPLITDGMVDFGANLTVDGFLNLNDALFVNNGAPVWLSGNMGTGGDTHFQGELAVMEVTTLNSGLLVDNVVDNFLSGTLEVDGPTTLSSSLEVRNQAQTELNGILDVTEQALLNNGLVVSNGSTTTLSGILNVEGISFFNNEFNVNNTSTTLLTGNLLVSEATTTQNLLVANGAKTGFTGPLNVQGESLLNGLLNIQGSSLLNNDLTVTGTSAFTSLTAAGIAISSDNLNYVATFSNTNSGDGGGIRINLGRNHGRWTGSSILSIDQTLISNDPGNGTPATDPLYITALNVVKTKFTNPGPFTMNEVISLTPAAMRIGSIGQINNLIFQEIQANLNFPKNLPSVTMPSFTVPGFENEIVFFGGLDPICSGQQCFSVCIPLVGCHTVCIPPVNVCVPRIPRIAFPALTVPNVNVAPTFNNFLPGLPVLSEAGLPDVAIPSLPSTPVFDSLSEENEYLTFLDQGDRKTGAIEAQSITDFFDNTILNDVYAFEVASEFIGLDPAKAAIKGGTTVVKLISEFNKLGVRYSSGNGDYAEWLERIDTEEPIVAGDIVAIKGGKITRNLDDFEQMAVVSHHPIVLGNMPNPDQLHLGNNVAFLGQVPVKVMGKVEVGDFIVGDTALLGYGVAISPSNMTTKDYKRVVGRSWETNALEGPKTIKVVVGLESNNFENEIQKIWNKQDDLDRKLDRLEKTIEQLEATPASKTNTSKSYATND